MVMVALVEPVYMDKVALVAMDLVVIVVLVLVLDLALVKAKVKEIVEGLVIVQLVRQ